MPDDRRFARFLLRVVQSLAWIAALVPGVVAFSASSQKGDAGLGLLACIMAWLVAGIVAGVVHCLLEAVLAVFDCAESAAETSRTLRMIADRQQRRQ